MHSMVQGLELTKQYVTQGVAYSDVNRDGWEDLFITTITIRDTVYSPFHELSIFYSSIIKMVLSEMRPRI